jgi:hypothetical protein
MPILKIHPGIESGANECRFDYAIEAGFLWAVIGIFQGLFYIHHVPVREFLPDQNLRMITFLNRFSAIQRVIWQVFYRIKLIYITGSDGGFSQFKKNRKYHSHSF